MAERRDLFEPGCSGSQLALTFDIDWAPDWCIAECAALCRSFGVKATFFVTHRSDILADLRPDPLFELGIHPNFLEGSTQGATRRAVLDYCLDVVPEARSMRTHALVQSSPIFVDVCVHYQTIQTDVSLLLPFHTGLRPVDMYAGENRRRLTRLPYFWEDDTVSVWPNWDWSSLPACEGLAIFDFHPTYVALNMQTTEGYEQLKSVEPRVPLFTKTPDEFAPYVHPGPGTRTMLHALLESHPARDFMTISEITAKHRGQLP